MALLGKGMLITFTQVSDADEEDYNEWYNREHIDERVWMPGFHRARRYVADGPAPIKYFATYETDTVEDLAHPDYMKRLANQTEWSQRVMGRFTAFERLTVTVSVDLTHGFGGAVGLARFFPEEGVRDALRAHLGEELLPHLGKRAGMLGACLVENDLAVSDVGVRAQGKEPPESQTPEWIVILEGADVETVRTAVSFGFGSGLERFGLAPDAFVLTTYRFLFGNAR